MRTMILIINLVCLAFMIFNMINIAKTDKEMDKMFKKLDEDFIKKMKALELIHEVVNIPDKFYLGVNSNDLLEVTLFECDDNMPNKMGRSIETFYLESYRSNELISFGIELLNYINEKAFKNE